VAPAGVVAGPPAPPGQPGPVAGEREPGQIERMARAYVDALPYGPNDPRRMQAELAVAVARRVDQDGAVPAAVRELRTLIGQLIDVPNQPAGEVDELRLRRAQRRFDSILGQAEELLAATRAGRAVS
jgi:hypothetical protein